MSEGDTPSPPKKTTRKTAAKKTAAKKTVAKNTAAKKTATKTKTKVKTKGKTKTATKAKAATKKVSGPKKEDTPVAAPLLEKLEPPNLPAGTAMTEALGESFLNDLIANWHANGHEVIENCRTAKPDVYLRLVATYAPKEFRKRLQPFEELTDDELKARLDCALKELKTLGLD